MFTWCRGWCREAVGREGLQIRGEEDLKAYGVSKTHTRKTEWAIRTEWAQPAYSPHTPVNLLLTSSYSLGDMVCFVPELPRMP